MTGARFRGVATTLVVLSSVATLSTGVAAASRPIALKARLLSVSDLPAGWAATYSEGSSRGPCGLSVFRTKTKHGHRATVTFADGSTTQLEEGLATGRGELERWKSLGHNLSTCHQTSFSDNGKTAKLTIGAMSFPKVSRTSKAFAMTVT